MLLAKNLCQSVSVADGTLDILKGVNLKINRSESVAIVGPSGSGKSTLLGILAGLDTPTQGEVHLNGAEITGLNEEARSQVRGQYVSFVFQNFQLLDSLTALENVVLPLEVKNQDNALEKAHAYIERVGLSKRLTHYPKQLSGGEQQRIAIARAFACEAPVLFADEPTGNLDSATGAKISDLLFAMNEESDTTLVLVTHDLTLASRCNRTLKMNAGTLSE
ncbi:ABC transporter ATP-binding protein [Teredinibacter sp. KSP-S5-2]|uniref:ABC transporter ATP-binding protein n=1 Tax=Teredinibacter sp. KSP-S5-2 TaxID=3034506 RepID=UPI00293521AD|nr:ABC transporter ATP-binding protein [Teredinibacter sp. KSP-S5-2]WNO08404.1 ABC transporter ATP-binding protein [Teredinibacter sp. KSP-S5-2]